MKKIAAAVLFCLAGTVVHAQSAYTANKEVICSTLKEIVEFVSGPDYQEQPQWTGNDQNSKYLMTLNTKTGSWTLIQYNDKQACIIGAGINFKMIFSSRNSI